MVLLLIDEMIITKLSGLVDFRESGDDMIAAKDFTLRKLLAEKSVALSISQFWASSDNLPQLKLQNLKTSQKLRIHVKRIKRRI